MCFAVIFPFNRCLRALKMEKGGKNMKREESFRQKETELQATGNRWYTHVDSNFESITSIQPAITRLSGEFSTPCEYRYLQMYQESASAK